MANLRHHTTSGPDLPSLPLPPPPTVTPSSALFKQCYINVYSTSFLSRYDYWVLNITCAYIWHCSTPEILLPMFAKYMSGNHLDIGVGSGYFLAASLRLRARTSTGPETERPYSAEPWGFNTGEQRLALWDLSGDALATARKRIQAVCPLNVTVSILPADATRDLPEDLAHALRAASPTTKGLFTSVSASLVLHCIPGSTASKTAGLAKNAARWLADDGVFFGSTVVSNVWRGTSVAGGYMDWVEGGQRVRGDEWRVDGGVVARVLLWLYNTFGVFCNRGDGPDDVVHGLYQGFHQVDSWIVGNVLLFRCRSPRR